MALPAGRELQRARRARRRRACRPGVGQRRVVEPGAALGDQPAGVLARAGEAGPAPGAAPPRCRRPGCRRGASVSVGRSSPTPPSLEHRARRRLGRRRRLARRGRARVTSLASVILAALISAPPSAPEAVAFLDRQLGVELEEPADVGVGRVAPELPELVGRQHLGVEPDRAAGGLAHLAPVRGGQERRGQAEDLGARDAAGQVDAVDDVAPLVRAAHLQEAAVAAVELQEVVGLQDHVVELEEAQRLVAVEPRLDALEGQHPVDREVPADVAQEARGS